MINQVLTALGTTRAKVLGSTWAVVLAGWFVLAKLELPVSRFYVPLLLWKHLLPEICVIAVLITGYVARDVVSTVARKIAYVAKKFLQGGLPFFWICVVLLLVDAAVFWKPNIRRLRHTGADISGIIRHRSGYYRNLVSDYYPRALYHEGQKAYQAGDLQTALKFFEDSGTNSGEGYGTQSASERAELVRSRIAYAQDQIDRSNYSIAGSSPGLSGLRLRGRNPLSVSLDIDALRAFPGNVVYQRRVADDLDSVDSQVGRVSSLSSGCAPGASVPIIGTDSAAVDSFSPGAVIVEGGQLKISCSALQLSCAAGSSSCAANFARHMFKDKLDAACLWMSSFKDQGKMTVACGEGLGVGKAGGH